MEVFLEVCSRLTDGFINAFFLFILTLVFSLPLGLIMSFCTMSKFAPLRIPVKLIVWVLRGTPLMLQIFAIFYLPGLLRLFVWPQMNTGWEWFDSTFSTRFIAALVAFAINYAAYFSEIFRGGIQSISQGQYEAGQVLGMTKSQIFFKIVLLQVVKRIIPPMSNEIITLIKDTSLANTIAVYELIYEAKEFMTVDGLIWPLFVAGAFYLIFVGLLTILFNHMEKKLDYFRS
ncbi:MAG: amino acid ABC transporter permease [Clostridia bacterium]|nr:amino acid ABC transporter permease [Clostridia bacterium]MBO5299735.1 amino acid ABC transporter permease [Clostridia bacterium]